MDSTAFFIKGMILGFSIAAPVGPIGILCIKRTLSGGMIQGLLSGLGAAAADACYGFLAAFGITAVSELLAAGSLWIRLCGGVFLLYLGFSIFRSRPAKAASTAEVSGRLAAFTSTFFLTLANPMTILSFTAIFAGLGAIGSEKAGTGSAQLVLGVFAGSLLWWICLAALVGNLRSRLDETALSWINRFAGLIICGFALHQLAAVLAP